MSLLICEQRFPRVSKNCDGIRPKSDSHICISMVPVIFRYVQPFMYAFPTMLGGEAEKLSVPPPPSPIANSLQPGKHEKKQRSKAGERHVLGWYTGCRSRPAIGGLMYIAVSFTGPPALPGSSVNTCRHNFSGWLVQIQIQVPV